MLYIGKWKWLEDHNILEMLWSDFAEHTNITNYCTCAWSYGIIVIAYLYIYYNTRSNPEAQGPMKWMTSNQYHTYLNINFHNNVEYSSCIGYIAMIHIACTNLPCNNAHIKCIIIHVPGVTLPLHKHPLSGAVPHFVSCMVERKSYYNMS